MISSSSKIFDNVSRNCDFVLPHIYQLVQRFSKGALSVLVSQELSRMNVITVTGIMSLSLGAFLL